MAGRALRGPVELRGEPSAPGIPGIGGLVRTARGERVGRAAAQRPDRRRDPRALCSAGAAYGTRPRHRCDTGTVRWEARMPSLRAGSGRPVPPPGRHASGPDRPGPAVRAAHRSPRHGRSIAPAWPCWSRAPAPWGGRWTWWPQACAIRRGRFLARGRFELARSASPTLGSAARSATSGGSAAASAPTGATGTLAGDRAPCGARDGGARGRLRATRAATAGAQCR